MIHPADLEERIGFDQIRARLQGHCLGSSGAARTRQACFTTDHRQLSTLLRQTAEVMTLLDQGEDLPLIRYADPEPSFQAAGAEGAFIEATDLLALAQGVECAIQCSEKIQKKNEIVHLKEVAVVSPDCQPWVKRIRSKIDEEGNVRDTATPSLSSIRRRLREESRKVRRMADQVLARAISSGWSPDGAQVTVRQGRLVIPVTAEHKRKLAGYVVDQSSTGQTFFIEPGEVVEAHNELRDLELEERAEVMKVLRELTSSLRENKESLEAAFVLLGFLDFTRAKAKLARTLGAIVPVLEEKPLLQWYQARHPLLFFSLSGKRPLVPLDISLDPEARFLLVSGPNAGGKSVCLKTVGLIQYMLQCGLPVPLGEGSTCGIFENILLDIGDQQSIENDLSTYSSHLKNMSLFLREANAHSIVLMDELGSGTDPDFGGGIAQAVLESLLAKGAWGVATTHYYDLKVFAGQHPGIRNAAMLFDRDKLEPLFRLSIGQPGSSFALEIASRSGLPQEVIRSAERIIGKELTGLESLMKQVEEERVKQTMQAGELKKLEKQLAEALTHYRELSGQLESRKKEILQKAKLEASTLLQQTNKEIEKTIRHIRENKAEKQETKKVRQGLKSLQERVKPVEPAFTDLPGEIRKGDNVRMRDGEVSGKVLSLKGKSAEVQFGDLRSTVRLDKLVRSSAPKSAGSKGMVKGIELHRRQSDFASVLDIRGKRAEEVMPLLVRFMDDALLTSQSEVKIIHGKGEGVLRQIVRDYLGKIKHVSSIRDEHADRGGEGVTIVGLD